ncbi:MAG TPA: hypothetical protein PLJ60_09340 [Chryseolinea sp.]|nr:hypothetical protein [Chryseolinea sp.]HPH45590.1 hypothetical protein [Chryseolinea sp.]HPM30530.1 hypothetical protein [Chryseolinea sp.]
MVDLHRIKSKKVKKFLIDNQLIEHNHLKDYRSLCYNTSHASTYSRHFKSFIVKENIEDVWNAYKTINPTEAWNGKMVSFGMGYCKRQNKISYLEDQYTGMEAGQIIFLNLNILGLTNLAVAHEVKEVNEAEKFFKLSYMANGKSEGSQWIRFVSTPEGHTEILHETKYKSGSSFRDKRIYPIFHTKAISEFHNSVRRKINSMK